MARKSSKKRQDQGRAASKGPNAVLGIEAARAGSDSNTTPSSGGDLSPTRKWVFRLAALILLPALLFGGLEMGLRIAGYGYSPAFFTPATVEGRKVLVQNDLFSMRFFPPELARIPAAIVMERNKPAGTTRIFVFGESAALGDPRLHFGASRYLEALLRERYPGWNFEVINTAVTAINSHVILPIARECAQHEGDIWIVYMGNNEMVGPFGAATVFGRQAAPWPLARLTIGIQGTRVGQLLVGLSRALPSRSSKPGVWQGMEMFLQNTVTPDDPRRETVYKNFQKNLEDILHAGIGSGAKVVLSTVAVNLEDCPPFRSEGAERLTEAARAEFTKESVDATEAAAQGNHQQARRGYERALAVLPQSAETHYRLADCLLRLTNFAAARDHFQRAVDCDSLPFRADSRINAAISRTAQGLAGRGVALCDAGKELAASTPEGIAGKESFYEHVHPNFDGNYRLGRAWAAEVEKLLPVSVRQAQTPDWCSQEQCERRLGLTDWNRLSTAEEVQRRLKGPPFDSQMGHQKQMDELQAWISQLKARKASADLASLRALYEQALAAAPGDHLLHENYAEFLEGTKDFDSAIRERQKVRELAPHSFFSHYALGQLLAERGRLDEALASLQEALRLNRLSSDVRLELGKVYGRLSQWEPALQNLQEARRLDPENSRICLYLGEILGKLGRKEEAVAALREAIQLKPDYWEAHYRLGEQLGQQGAFEAAARELRETLRYNPGYVKAHLNLGVALVKMGRPEEAIRSFDTVLQLDPQNSLALQFKMSAEAALRGKRR